MWSRMMISVAITAALVTAPVGFGARSCILSSAPVERACKPGSCANKSCCATSNEHKSNTTQPLAKSDSTYQVNASSVALPTAVPPSFESGVQVFPGYYDAFAAPSAPTLALICIRLI